VVNKASSIAFLVSGPGKADALNEVLRGKFNPEKYPSQLIKPENGQLHWFVDEQAAANIILAK
jgi:6-phosphogluconolactonase